MAVRSRPPIARTLPLHTLKSLQSVQTLEQAPALPSLGFPFRLLLLLGILPFLLLSSVIVVYREQLNDRVYPGVTIFDVNVGRLTPEEAAAAVKRHLVEQSRRPFHLRYDADAFTTSLTTLGVRIDDAEISQLTARAWNVGREDEILPWLRTHLALLRRGYALPTSLSFDRKQAEAVLGRVALDVERPTVNASLSVVKAGEQYEVHTTPAYTGRRLNVNATLDRLQQSLVNTIPRSLDLVLDEAPPGIGDQDIVPAVETIQILLGSPLELKDGPRTWKLEPAAAYSMLEISGLEAGRPPVTAKLNEAKLREFVERTGRAADQPAQNPTFDVQGDEVVIRKGVSGKVTDVNATFEVAKERSASATRSVDIVFTEDKPWVTEADLEPVRAQANSLLSLPITLETPELPGIEARKWVLDRATLSQMLVLPNTQSAPRDYQTLPPDRRPRFEIQLDSGKVTNYLAREIAPWVSADPVDAALQLRTTQVEVPNPAYAAALAAEGGPRTAGVPPTLRETRHTVELRNSVDGRGPDYLATFAGMQILFKSGTSVDPAERRVTIRLTSRPPRVQDRELIPARDMANLLIGEPVAVRWQTGTWTVSRDELAGMLRYQPGTNGLLTAYLTRDGLLAKATAIAREAERRPDAPKDSRGNPLKVDIPATASAIWLQASTVRTNRVATVVWDDEAPAPPGTP